MGEKIGRKERKKKGRKKKEKKKEKRWSQQNKRVGIKFKQKEVLCWDWTQCIVIYMHSSNLYYHWSMVAQWIVHLLTSKW